jgi:hypothetical protein
MIIVFNWKDKIPASYQNIFSYYQDFAQKVLLIVCPAKKFFQNERYKFVSLTIKYCIQKPDLDMMQVNYANMFDYVMINHQRFKEKILNKNIIDQIINYKKKPIICFSSIDEIIQIKDTEAIWAYEPAKNIGSSDNLDLDEILQELSQIKQLRISGKLLYGGGVRNDNFLEIHAKIGYLVDGFLIGEKSLDPNFLQTFIKLILNIGQQDQNIVSLK